LLRGTGWLFAGPLTRRPPPAPRSEGNTEFAAKNMDKAIEKYTEAIATDPSHVYYSNRAAVYLEQQDWDKAEADAKECIRIDPTFIKGFFRLARAQDGKNDFAGAIATVREGLEKHPGNNELSRLLRAITVKKKASQSKSSGAASQVQSEEMMEMLEKVRKTQIELMQVKSKIQGLLNEKKRMALTRGHLADMPTGVNTYQSVGKMFMQSDKAEISTFFDGEDDVCDRNVEKLQKQVEYLERRKASHEANIKDMAT